MNNPISKQKNQIFLKVQEDLIRFFSIIMYKVENSSKEDFDYIISHSDNPEEIELAQILKKDDLDRETRIKQQAEKTKKVKQKLENKTVSVPQPKIKTLSNEQFNKVNNIIKKSENKDNEQDLEI